jgi:hypothetical protein
LPTLPDPFVRFPESWARDPKIPLAERGLLIVLLSHRNRRTGQCNPSHEALAYECGLSIRSVIRLLESLRDLGLITWRRTSRTNWYSILDVTGMAEQVGSRSDIPDTSDMPDMAHPDVTAVAHKPEEGNQMNEPATTPPDGGLFAADVVEQKQPEVRPPNAGDLVAAWVDGFSEQRGRPPDDSVVRRVAGNCKQVANTRGDVESWRVAWFAAKDAGRRGQYDVVAYLADYQPPRRAGDRISDAQWLAEQGYWAVDQPAPPTVGWNDDPPILG